MTIFNSPTVPVHHKLPSLPWPLPWTSHKGTYTTQSESSCCSTVSILLAISYHANCGITRILHYFVDFIFIYCSPSLSAARKLFDGLITQQKEPTSPQKVRGRGRINLQNQRVKEKRPRVQNPNSIFQQLLNRFDPNSFQNSNASQQVQS